MNQVAKLTPWEKCISSASRVIPTTYYGILSKELENNATVLDVACGTGIPMSTLNKFKQYRVTGVDLFEPYLQIVRKRDIYENAVKADIRNLPFPEKSFDVVIALHIIEHLEKEEGIAFMRQLEKIARKKVIIATPNGFLRQDGYDNNYLQEHKCGWYPEEMINYGYTVTGQGWNIFHGNGYLARWSSKNTLLGLGRDITSAVVQPILQHFPAQCYQIICVKHITALQ